ncbi:MAG: 16S rRNA (cytosine(1402)-N(4))-methyltransferase RsmH [Calditrichaeota bacterium]|nr:MAG: 16S rRNA (cytosine(1402)-N(4))-methyltransferase RsmH [Calditrichota bacterium]
MKNLKNYHISVLLNEVLNFIPSEKEGYFIDGTLGGGGHTRAILEKFPQIKVLGIDCDKDALIENKNKFPENRFTFCEGNFKEMTSFALQHNAQPLLGILLDLGVSSFQIDNAERGFSFQKDAELDMRMDKNLTLSAKDIVNSYSREDLTKIFREFGEEKNAWKISGHIFQVRKEKLIETTSQLVEVISQVSGGRFLTKTLARIFQALRIEVNQELESLRIALGSAIGLLAKGGRIGVISYHSLEDRIVKEFFRHEKMDCVCPPKMPICTCDKVSTVNILTKKPIMPAQEEIDINSRARSAKLRIAEKI